MEEATGGVAAESSIGTWTELTTSKAYVEKLKATVFEITILYLWQKGGGIGPVLYSNVI